MARMKLLERNNARRAAIMAKREAEQVKCLCVQHWHARYHID